MGLRADVQTGIAAAFDGALADAVRSFTLTRVTGTDYDPLTGEEAQTAETFQGRGVFGGFKTEQVDNEHILATDEKLTALQSEISTDPVIGDDIGGKRVMNTWQDPAGVAWIVQLRDA